MRKMLLFIGFFILGSIAGFAQTNEWGTQYVTFDDAINGTLNRTSSVAALGADDFVALVFRVTDDPSLINYLVGYIGADSANGRLGSPTGEEIGFWEFNLDHVDFDYAVQIAGDSDNRVYVANNDVDHNILVFDLTVFDVAASQYRMITGSDTIWGIEVDANGYVYVCAEKGDDTNTQEVKIFPPVTDTNAAWGTSHDSAPVATIDLPPGVYHGITASGDGSMVFVSQSSERKILKFTGSPTGGYAADASFTAMLDPNDLGVRADTSFFTPTYLGLAFMDDPGLVFAATDTLFHGGTSSGYRYGRIYVINAATGATVDTIDQAQWNFDKSGSYSTGSSAGLWSGFASSYDVDVEASEQAVYGQSWYGWAVEKWRFDGNLGDLLVGIEQISSQIPEGFSLKQNYPNPFNPTTTIAFDLEKAGFVTLDIFNLMGQKVATLIERQMAPGTYEAEFDASGFATGVYFYKLTSGNATATKKMLLTR